MRPITKIIYWIPTLLWLLTIFIFSSQPTLQTSGIVWQDFIFKKMAHFIEYAILTTLFIYSFKHTTKMGRTNIILLSLTLSLIYAISDEFHQSFVPGREPRIRDILIDALGSLSASLYYHKNKWLDMFNYRV